MTVHPLDLAVLLVYLVGITGWGIWLGRGQKGGRDYFLGGRELPWGAVTLSIISTETSTLTFLSVPGVAYLGSFTFLQLAFGYVVGRVIVAWVLLPAYYRGQLATAYQLLEERFGRGTRRFTSAIFMMTRLLADGVRLFATALPLALLTGWPLPVSILIMGIGTAIYAYTGGIRSVVWVDAAQTGIYMAGAVAAFIALGLLVPGGWGSILDSAAVAGKLRVIDPVLDFSIPYTLWAGLVGGAFLSMASHGTDHLMVQRVLTCHDLAGSRKALVTSGFAIIVQFAVFLAIGVGLWAFYEGREFARPDDAFATFIVEELPPGISGLLMAGVFAAAMSTPITALASACTYDFWAPAVGAESDDPRLLHVGRAFTGMWAVLLIGAAIAFIPLSREAAAIEVALGIASIVYGGLLGGFALAIFAPRARQAHAIAGIASGVATVTVIWLLARAEVAWPWFVPIGTAVTFAVGWTLSRFADGRTSSNPPVDELPAVP
ncbi:MAG: sodium:solute symporter [Gemmatimonadota bacterium]